MNSHNIKLILGYILALAISTTIIATGVFAVLGFAALIASFTTWTWFISFDLIILGIRVAYAMAAVLMAMFLASDHRGFMEIVYTLVDGDSDDLD